MGGWILKDFSVAETGLLSFQMGEIFDSARTVLVLVTIAGFSGAVTWFFYKD